MSCAYLWFFGNLLIYYFYKNLSSIVISWLKKKITNFFFTNKNNHWFVSLKWNYKSYESKYGLKTQRLDLRKSSKTNVIYTISHKQSLGSNVYFFISSSEGVMEGKLEPNHDTVTTSEYVKKCFKLIVDLLKNKKCFVS